MTVQFILTSIVTSLDNTHNNSKHSSRQISDWLGCTHLPLTAVATRDLDHLDTPAVAGKTLSNDREVTPTGIGTNG